MLPLGTKVSPSALLANARVQFVLRPVVVLHFLVVVVVAADIAVQHFTLLLRQGLKHSLDRHSARASRHLEAGGRGGM